MKKKYSEEECLEINKDDPLRKFLMEKLFGAMREACDAYDHLSSLHGANFAISGHGCSPEKNCLDNHNDSEDHLIFVICYGSKNSSKKLADYADSLSNKT